MDNTYWQLDSLERMGELPLRAVGAPRVVDSPYGKAIEFAGAADALFAEGNPLRGLAQFTLEILFRPDAGGLREQRFFHAGQVRDERVLFETRLTGDGHWYLDTFISSGESDCTLLNEGFLHSARPVVLSGYELRRQREGQLCQWPRGTARCSRFCRAG